MNDPAENLIKMSWNKKEMLDSINSLQKGIPVSWDRVVKTGDYIIVFGWIPNIKRDDFVAIIFLEEYFLYFTSSVEYTEKMSENWDCIEEHTNCIKFKEYFKKELESKEDG